MAEIIKTGDDAAFLGYNIDNIGNKYFERVYIESALNSEIWWDSYSSKDVANPATVYGFISCDAAESIALAILDVVKKSRELDKRRKAKGY